MTRTARVTINVAGNPPNQPAGQNDQNGRQNNA